MKYPKTLATVKGNEILAVIEGLPVSANGYFLTEEQMTNSEAAIVASEATAATLATVQAQLATATSAKETAEASLVTANARIAKLESEDGKIPAAAHAPKDINPVANDAKDFETSYDRERAQLEAMYK